MGSELSNPKFSFDEKYSSDLIKNIIDHKLALIVALSKNFPDKLIFGMEIRTKLVNFIGEKISCLRN